MPRYTRSLAAALQRHLTRVVRGRGRHEPPARSERFLAYTGVTRGLVDKGVAAWPWRTQGARATRDTADSRERALANAVAELRAYTDSELSDLALTRTGIEQAVRHGRPGLDIKDHSDAA